MVSRSDPITHLLLDFMKLREGGYPADAAWDEIMKEASQLSEVQVNNLLGLAKDWEKREGYKYRAQAKPEPKAKHTTMLDPRILEQIERAAKHPPGTQESLGDTSPLVVSNIQDDAYFDENTQLVISFKDFPQTPLKLRLKPGQEITIGRIAKSSVMLPDIDLTAVKGEHYGVSRLHALLENRKNRLYIADLGSANCTYLNGERLHPHESRALKNGDMLTFADLVTRIQFMKT